MTIPILGSFNCTKTIIFYLFCHFKWYYIHIYCSIIVVIALSVSWVGFYLHKLLILIYVDTPHIHFISMKLNKRLLEGISCICSFIENMSELFEVFQFCEQENSSYLKTINFHQPCFISKDNFNARSNLYWNIYSIT